jgi:hypothetical protein
MHICFTCILPALSLGGLFDTTCQCMPVLGEHLAAWSRRFVTVVVQILSSILFLEEVKSQSWIRKIWKLMSVLQNMVQVFLIL